MIKAPLILLALGATLLGGCIKDRIENRLDCAEICDRYQACYDADYDTATCKASCRDNANGDAGFERDVGACADCLDGASCLDAPFTCGAECSSVVP